MRVAVFGAGAVGGYYGARLAAGGADVAVVARGAHLAAIRAGGLRVESIAGDAVLRPSLVTDRPAEIGPVDWVVCGVKAWQVEEAAQAMRPLIGRDTGVLPLQNGVDAADQLGDAVGREHVVGGATWILAHVEAPGLIRHTGARPRIVFGELDGVSRERCPRLLAALRAGGVEAELSDRIATVVWSKFLFIDPVSALGAVTRRPLGEYRVVPETRRLLAAAIGEVRSLALAEGVPLPDDAVAETLALIDRLPAESVASMQRDVAAGRPSELHCQAGAVVRRARARGVATPVHDLLYAALLPGERAARGQPTVA